MLKTRGFAAAMLVLMLGLPMKGCSAPGAGALPRLAMSLAASVGSYFLIRAIK